MASEKMKDRTLILSTAASSTAYYLFYLFFTGAVQLFQTPRLGIQNISIIFSTVETQLYTGPLIQIVGDGFVLNMRIYPVLLGVLISLLVGYNAGILFTLWRKRLLRVCLVGSAWSGVGGLLASVVSFGYVCCGWPASIALFGVGLVTAFSPYLTAAAVALLALNGYVLRRRLQTLEKLKNIQKS
ncbi:MAG: hypothetical protein N3H84_03235 [Candidatus Caldarchaeum sp.]|nr:hypothetical protein [Candidatus Caldarchaeum sp.]